MIRTITLNLKWLVFGLFTVIVFQACGKTRFSSVPSNNQPSYNLGGEGFDGKLYSTYGHCDKHIEKTDTLLLASDLSSARLMRKDCKDLGSPEAVNIKDISFSMRDEAVLKYKNKIFDEEKPTKRVTVSWCDSTGATPTTQTLTWALADTAGAVFTNITQADGRESLPIETVAQGAYHYVSAPSQLEWFELLMGGPLTYSIGGQPERTIDTMTCSSQPTPMSLVQRRSATVVGFGTNYTFDISESGSGNLLVVGLSFLNPNTQCLLSITDNAPGGGNSYFSADARSADLNSGSAEIWFAANSRPGATTLSISLAPACSGQPPAFYFAEFSGIARVNPLYGTPMVINNQASTTRVTAPEIVTNERALVFSIATVQFDLLDLEAGSSFGSLSPAHGDAAAYHFSIRAGSYGAVWIQDNAGTYGASSVAFKAAW